VNKPVTDSFPSAVGICHAVAINTPHRDTPLLEEVHVHIGRHSVRDDADLRLHQSRYYQYSAETVMLALAPLSSLTALDLTGQFCVSPSAFDGFYQVYAITGFPELRSFRLDFGPDSTEGRWYFDPEESDRPVPGPPQQRTRFNNQNINALLESAAYGVTELPRIETFSLCLRDKFYFEVTKRTFEVHFVTKNKDRGGRATLTFKLGDKVDTWRPAREVLAAWTIAAEGKQTELEIFFEE
jgi:hypothetical protein